MIPGAGEAIFAVSRTAGLDRARRGGVRPQRPAPPPRRLHRPQPNKPKQPNLPKRPDKPQQPPKPRRRASPTIPGARPALQAAVCARD